MNSKKSIAERILERILDRMARMPRETNRRIAAALGRLWYRMDKRHRKIALENLKMAFGDELDEGRRQEICREVFDHLARVVMEIPYVRALNHDNLDQFATFRGGEHLQAALEKKQGLLVVTSHFGNWELMAVGFSMRYLPFNIVVRPLDNPFFDRMVGQMRCQAGNKTIQKRGSVRQVLRLLRKGEIVALLIDQNTDWYDAVFVPFFNELAGTNKALAVLALRTGAPVLPAYNVRRPDGRYELIIEPEIPIVRTGDTTMDIEENTARFNRVIEAYVRRNPEQWFWVHRRWKTRPYQPWPRQIQAHR
ncbi:lysophospholipid acyltransferase family protein [Desulforhabdus sp. TSK]|uniref:lysophospholipid acyltransferase family protein n=1 Tax=Desulforhabdus sp. TSK TaxID=2925014 RepID=UPI001FC883F2|nr:lysophospholipid acyltransferase family protein [Desulforhabdus sp. TSK]GKT09365.1 lipid A biosynthesis acyltransferase [Desulforhabdus sp. TSK]